MVALTLILSLSKDEGEPSRYFSSLLGLHPLRPLMAFSVCPMVFCAACSSAVAPDMKMRPEAPIILVEDRTYPFPGLRVDDELGTERPGQFLVGELDGDSSLEIVSQIPGELRLHNDPCCRPIFASATGH